MLYEKEFNPPRPVHLVYDRLPEEQQSNQTMTTRDPLGAPPDSMTDQTSHKVWATFINWVQYQFYYTAGEGTGQVTIDYYDPTISVTSAIVSGHFSFDAVN